MIKKHINSDMQLIDLIRLKSYSAEDIYVFGAKSTAILVYCFMKRRNCDINAFLVFNKGENVLNLLGKKVKSVDEVKGTMPCVIVAIGHQSFKSVSALLDKYDIDSLLFVTPQLLTKLPTNISVSGESKNSDDISLDNHVQIVCDETSRITIEEGCCFEDGVRIIATNNSIINIRNNTIVNEKTTLISENNSSLEIGSNSLLAEGISINVAHNSSIHFGDNITIGKHSRIGCVFDSEIKINDSVSAESNNFIHARKSGIKIEKDSMLSLDVGIIAGSHPIYSKEINEEITHLEPIVVGEHVWIGKGAVLLSGANIGGGSVVGANSVVKKKIAANCTCAGNPAVELNHEIYWRK